MLKTQYRYFICYACQEVSKESKTTCSSKPVMVAKWLACLTNMREVSQSNLASYLYWNMHVGKRSTAFLATKELAGVAPEVNLREHISCMPLPSVNKAALSGFETQRRHHQKSKTGVPVAPQKGLMSSKIKKKHMKGCSQWLHYLIWSRSKSISKS